MLHPRTRLSAVRTLAACLRPAACRSQTLYPDNRHPSRWVHGSRHLGNGAAAVQSPHDNAPPAEPNQAEWNSLLGPNWKQVLGSDLPKANILSLYRRLIRQAHYLYDDYARTYMSRYIRKRFEMSRHDDERRQKQHIDAGEKGYRTLLRANAGDHKTNLKVLAYSYGRKGERRYELLKPVRNGPMPPPPDIPLREVERQAPQLSKPLIALLQAHNLPLEPKLSPKTPLPENRELNLRKKHFAKILNLVNMPLPTDDYERLVRLVNGDEVPIPPTRKIPRAAKQMRTNGEDDPGYPKLHLKLVRQSRTTAGRIWRRLWSKILEDVPVLKYDEKEDRWTAHLSPQLMLKKAGKRRMTTEGKLLPRDERERADADEDGMEDEDGVADEDDVADEETASKL